MCAGGTQAPARAEAGAHCGWLGSTRRRGRHPWPAGDAHGAAQPAAVTRVSAVVGARAAASCHKVGGAGAHVLGRSQYLHARSRSREPTPRAARSILRRAAETQQRRLHSSHARRLNGCVLLGLSKFSGSRGVVAACGVVGVGRWRHLDTHLCKGCKGVCAEPPFPVERTSQNLTCHFAPHGRDPRARAAAVRRRRPRQTADGHPPDPAPFPMAS